MLVVLTLTNGFQVFFPGSFTASSFLAGLFNIYGATFDVLLIMVAYITIPAFLLLYFGHKIYFRTPWVRKIEDVDVTTGKEEADALEAMSAEPVPKNFVQKAWFWIV